MKILGTTTPGRYLCEVSHDELEKLADKYYDKLEKLAHGDEFDLAQGYHWFQRIRAACNAMEGASKAFGDAQKTMLAFAKLVAQTAQEEQAQKEQP